MPTKCRYVRPGGPRAWDSAKLRSLACSLVRKGTKPEAICDAIAECVDCDSQKESKCEKEKSQVQSLVRALQFASDALDSANRIIDAFGILTQAVALVARFAPPARPAAAILQRLSAEVQFVRAQVQASLEYAKLMARLQGGVVPRELAHLIPR